MTETEVENFTRARFAATLPAGLSVQEIQERWVRESPRISRQVRIYDTSDARSEAEWSAAHRQIFRQQHCRLHPIPMPLKQAIKSDDVIASFFKGPGAEVMSSSFISQDSEIGAYTYIGFNTMVTKTTIGNYVSIANNVSVGPGEHAIDDISTSSIFYENAREKLTAKSCSIGHDAWIAEGCIIRRGVSIGIGAIVGANSFVNADVEPFTIVAGSPARVVGKRFDDETIAAIMESRWWDHRLERSRVLVAELKNLLDAKRPQKVPKPIAAE